MMSAAAEARIETRMDTIACLDDVASQMLKIEDRIIEIRKRTAEHERVITTEEQCVAVLSAEESDLHFQMHRLARQVLDDKKNFVQANATERRKSQS